MRPGVVRLPKEYRDSSSVSRDGIDSVERERVEVDAPSIISLSELPLLTSSDLGGRRRKSQVRGLEDDNRSWFLSFSLLRSLFPISVFLLGFVHCTRCGMADMANKAVTDVGIADESWGVGFCPMLLLFSTLDPSLFRLEPSPKRVGITTGFEGEGGEGDQARDMVDSFCPDLWAEFLSALMPSPLFACVVDDECKYDFGTIIEPRLRQSQIWLRSLDIRPYCYITDHRRIESPSIESRGCWREQMRRRIRDQRVTHHGQTDAATMDLVLENWCM